MNERESGPEPEVGEYQERLNTSPPAGSQREQIDAAAFQEEHLSSDEIRSIAGVLYLAAIGDTFVRGEYRNLDEQPIIEWYGSEEDVVGWQFPDPNWTAPAIPADQRPAEEYFEMFAKEENFEPGRFKRWMAGASRDLASTDLKFFSDREPPEPTRTMTADQLAEWEGRKQMFLRVIQDPLHASLSDHDTVAKFAQSLTVHRPSVEGSIIRYRHLDRFLKRPWSSLPLPG